MYRSLCIEFLPSSMPCFSWSHACSQSLLTYHLLCASLPHTRPSQGQMMPFSRLTQSHVHLSSTAVNVLHEDRPRIHFSLSHTCLKPSRQSLSLSHCPSQCLARCLALPPSFLHHFHPVPQLQDPFAHGVPSAWNTSALLHLCSARRHRNFSGKPVLTSKQQGHPGLWSQTWIQIPAASVAKSRLLSL